MATHRVEIIPGNPPTVDQETLHISKENGDHVQWWSRSHDWAVAFGPDSPFGDHYFARSQDKSERITVDPATREYKYTIFVDGNSADPIIIVDH